MGVTVQTKKKTKKKTAKKKTTKKVTKKATKKKTAKKKTSASAEYDLVIVESPSKAKTIKKYLGRGFQVIASNGHIKDLPKSKLGIDLKDNFKIDLVPINGKADKISRIQELSKNANNIFLAPDPDREGEAIAFHIKEEIPKKKKVQRITFNAVTKSEVQKAISQPSELNQNMYDSQKTRRVLDRLVGYKISPILWDKVQRGISAGRVQSVALRMIVERENEIKAFVPDKWFSIHGVVKKENNPFEIKYYGEEISKKYDLSDDESFVNKIIKDTKGKEFKIVEVKKKELRDNPKPPFITSKLQQEASYKLGFSAKKTMMVAQKLYEGVQIEGEGLQGLITYMRTDSKRIAPEAIESVREYIKKAYGDKYLPAEAIEHNKKKKGSNSKVQDAHEAIRPANLELTPEKVKGNLDSDQQKLYELIWNKFIASQMTPAVKDQTAVMFESQGHFFKANGSVIKFPGYTAVYQDTAAEKVSKKNDDDDEDIKNGILPNLEEGEIFKLEKGPESVEHWTSPPPRFNEASLVKTLEENGIGRPSTYAAIISNIQDRGYVDKNENRFYPSELGMIVCKMLVESFPDIMDVKFTAKIEEQLDKIEEGDENWKKVLKGFWKDFEKTLEKAKEEMKNLKKTSIPTGIKCPKCSDGEYIIKWGRNGQFLACSNYPDCTSTEDFKKRYDGTIEIIPKTYHSDPCPTCGKKLIVKKGKYGRFCTCEDYPKCETTLPYLLDVNCPECKKGRFTEKTSRYGKMFFGCSSYPDCENAMWTKPYKYDCPGCGYPVMGERQTKKDGKHLQCSKCKHKVEWEITPFYKKDEE